MKHGIPVAATVQRLLKNRNQGVKIDLGCGSAKQGPDWIGVDYRDLPGVDIVHNLELFPYPLPDSCASVVLVSHVLEHMDPHPGDARLLPLIQLLLDKGIVTQKEIRQSIGEIDPGPRFMRMMDEMWRILRPGGQLVIGVPYAGSTGYWQDPTHLNGINEVTWAYFDPFEPNTGGMLYKIYTPKPWKIIDNSWSPNGIGNVLLEKRPDDPSYHEYETQTR